MVLSRREQIIGLVTAAVVGLLAIDNIALSPLLDRRATVATETLTAQGDVQRAAQLLANSSRMDRRWNDMVAAGLKSEPAESKSQAMRMLLDWAHDAGVSLTSLQPDRGDGGVGTGAQKQKDFQQITLRASGTGSMRSISRFLWQVQNAEIPIRVTDLQIDSRKPGSDELMLTLAVSTLCLAPPPPASANKPVVAMAAGFVEVTR